MNKVLLIDDDEMDLDLLRILFKKEGYEVLMTADGPQGVALFKEHHPTFVLLDLGLPSSNGLEILKEIKKIDSQAKVILITGYGSAETARAAMRAGALDFVEKTWDVGDMLRRIKISLNAFS